MHKLLHHLLQHFPQQPEQANITLALSGGLDSVVLLHLLCQARAHRAFVLRALHVHHGLSPNADGWQQFCQQLCAIWDVPFHSEKVQFNADNIGIEAAARAARYRILAQQNADWIALAHHADDQVETFLLAALRGGGVRALAGMGAEHDAHCVSGSLKLWRPLLGQSRAVLADYAEKYDLKWVEDESNADTNYLRNFVRQTCLPMLQTRLPDVKAQILASIAALQTDLALFNEWAAADKAQIHQNGQWSLVAWRKLGQVRGQQLLRQLAHDECLGTPSRHSVANFAHVAQIAEQAEWRLPCGRVFLFQKRFVPVSDAFLNTWFWCVQPFSGSLKTILMHLGEQQASFRLPENEAEQNGLLRAARREDALLMSNGQHQKVFKILAQNGVPAALREQYPVLLDEMGKVLAVLNLRVCADWQGQGVPQFLPLEKVLNRRLK